MPLVIKYLHEVTAQEAAKLSKLTLPADGIEGSQMSDLLNGRSIYVLPKKCLWLEEGEVIEGWLTLSRSHIDRYPPFVELNLYVDARLRRMGIGAKLVEAALPISEENWPGVPVRVWPWDGRSRLFFQTFGDRLLTDSYEVARALGSRMVCAAL